MKKIFGLFIFVLLMLPVSMYASQQINSASHEFYQGKDYYYHWSNNTSYDLVYGEMYETDTGTSAQNGDAGVWLARNGSGGTWKTVCSQEENLVPGDNVTCASSDKDNSYSTFDTHGKYNRINNGYSSLSSRLA